MYDLDKLELELETIMDDGYGKSFKKFSESQKQEVINEVVDAFDNEAVFVLRSKYVVAGKSGELLPEDFRRI